MSAARGRKRDFEEAIQNCTSALKADPTNASLLHRRGDAKRKLGNLEEAMRDFDAALRIAPKHVQALAGRGVCRRTKGQLKEAVCDFDAALALQPNNATTMLERCAALRALGRTEDALNDADGAVKLGPRNPSAQQLRGELRRKLGKYKEAIEDFNNALGIEPKNVSALAGRGAAQRAMGRLTGALADLDLAYKLQPNNAAVLVSRGSAKLELGRCGEALTDFQAALKLTPEDAFAKWGQNMATRQSVMPLRHVTLAGFPTSRVNKLYVERRQPEFCVDDRETFWSVEGDLFVFWCAKEKRWKGSRSRDLQKIQSGASCAFFGSPAGTDLLAPDYNKGWHQWDGKTWSQVPAAGVASLGPDGAPARSVTLTGFVGAELNVRFVEVRHTDFSVGGRETFWSEDKSYFLFWCIKEKRWKGSKAGDLPRNRGGASKAMIAAPVSADLLSFSLLKGWHQWDGKAWSFLQNGGVAGLGVIHA